MIKQCKWTEPNVEVFSDLSSDWAEDMQWPRWGKFRKQEALGLKNFQNLRPQHSWHQILLTLKTWNSPDFAFWKESDWELTFEAVHNEHLIKSNSFEENKWGWAQN